MQAARAAGLSNFRIQVRHILPGHVTPELIAEAIKTKGGPVDMTTLGDGKVTFADDGGIGIAAGGGLGLFIIAQAQRQLAAGGQGEFGSQFERIGPLAQARLLPRGQMSTGQAQPLGLQTVILEAVDEALAQPRARRGHVHGDFPRQGHGAAEALGRQVAGILPVAHPGNDGALTSGLGGRITSYNVCYTKLLRVSPR